MRYKSVLSLITIAGIAWLDFLTKEWILSSINALPIHIGNNLSFILTFNHGISFGLLASFFKTYPLSLTVLAGFLTLVLVYFLITAEKAWNVFAFALMIGGALGNNVDRHVRGAVVDFIDVHAAGYHWPAFNVADSALCLGVFIVLITTWREPKRPSQKKIHL